MMLRIPQINNQKGWILIDSLIGVVIVSITLTAIVLTFTQTTKTSTLAANRSIAISLGQQALESLKKYDGGSAAPSLTNSQVTVNGVKFSIVPQTVSVTTISNYAKLIPVQVTVSWFDGSDNQTNSIQMMSYYYYN